MLADGLELYAEASQGLPTETKSGKRKASDMGGTLKALLTRSPFFPVILEHIHMHKNTHIHTNVCTKCTMLDVGNFTLRLKGQ